VPRRRALRAATLARASTRAIKDMSDRSQFRLLGQRRFAPFFFTQFLGAFNDNVFKNAIVILITFGAVRLSGASPAVVVNMAAVLFILPFFLFSATAGQLADKYDKAMLIRWIKALEIVIMAVAAFGFVRRDAHVLLGTLFLMGLHSTLFGPVKYSLLPQVLKEEELVGGNALVESGTFLAILLGTILGGILAALPRGPDAFVPAVTIGVAALGWLVSRGIRRVPPPDPGLVVRWNPIRETWRNLQFAAGNRTVFLSIFGVSWFWFVGSMFLSQVPTFVHGNLGGSATVVTLFLAVFSIGIAVGSLLCERMSGHKVEIGLVPFGAIGLTVFALDLYLASPGGAATGGAASVREFLVREGSWRILLDLAGLALFGGFYVVPLYALIQTRAEKSHQSRIIAANNILNALFMVAAAGLAAAYLHVGLSVPQLFLVTAVLNAVVAVYIFSLVPEFLMRFLAWMLIHTVYRLDKQGLANIPEEGPALIVCNHVSFVDAIVIMGASPRPIRFVMDHNIFRVPVLSFVFRTSKAIPIAGRKEDPALTDKAFAEVARALREGELVGIFPEGRITDNGELYPFRPGLVRILEETPVPVVPMALRGLWGSFFSRKGGAAMTRPFRRGVFSRIALVVDAPWTPERATPQALAARVAELRGDWR
jgi:1-acyl-sn-glycerol-3-phosphate acyltransferase